MNHALRASQAVHDILREIPNTITEHINRARLKFTEISTIPIEPENADHQQQSILSKLINKHTISNIQNNNLKKLMESTSGAGLALFPGDYDLRVMPDEDFSAAMLVYLNLHKRINRPQHRMNLQQQCDQPHTHEPINDNQHSSIVGCKYCSEATGRHNQVANILYSAARTNGIASHKDPKRFTFNVHPVDQNNQPVQLRQQQQQQPVKQLEPFDIHFDIPIGNTGETKIVGYDIAVIDTLDAQQYEHMAVNEAYQSKVIAKHRKYDAVIRAYNDQHGNKLEFVPLVFSAYLALPKSMIQ